MPSLVEVFPLLCLMVVLLWQVFIWLRIEVLRVANAELIADVVAQLGKAKAEIVAKIGGLEAAVASGEDLSGPLAELVAAAQGLDDVVPDDVVPDEPLIEFPEQPEDAPVE